MNVLFLSLSLSLPEKEINIGGFYTLIVIARIIS